MTLGNKIKELRTKNKLTQQRLADLLYVSDKTISSWECDRTIPDLNILFKLSNILNADILYFIDESSINNLSLEIEIKLKLDKKDYNYYFDFLKNNGKFICECNQEDTYFAPTKNIFNNEWLRIRTEDGKSIVSFKRKINDECSEEYDSYVGSKENISKILEYLDLCKKGTIYKKRFKFLYLDKYEFSFDEVKDIGFFMEIEVVKHEHDMKKEITDLFKLLNNLNIDIKLIDEKRYFDYL